MEVWVSDVRYALRGWMRQPGFVLIAVLSLAAGIGLNTAVFSIINAIFLQGIRGVPAAGPGRHGRRARVVRDVRGCATAPAARCGGRVAAGWRRLGRARRRPRRRCRSCPTSTSRRSASVPARGRFFTSDTSACRRSKPKWSLDHEFWGSPSAAEPEASVRPSSSTTSRHDHRASRRTSSTVSGPERPPLWMPMGLLPAVRGAARRVGRRRPSPAGACRPARGRRPMEQINAELRRCRPREPERFRPSRCASRPAASAWSGAVSGEKRIEFLLVVVLPLVVVA